MGMNHECTWSLVTRLSFVLLANRCRIRNRHVLINPCALHIQQPSLMRLIPLQSVNTELENDT